MTAVDQPRETGARDTVLPTGSGNLFRRRRLNTFGISAAAIQKRTLEWLCRTLLHVACTSPLYRRHKGRTQRLFYTFNVVASPLICANMNCLTPLFKLSVYSSGQTCSILLW